MYLQSLEILNPWWEDPAAIERDQHLMAIHGAPFYFDNPIKRSLPLVANQAYILRGSRQVGKTTLLKEKIHEGLRSGSILPRHCLYLSCEAIAEFGELQTLLTRWIEPVKDAPVLMCLDEVTFVPEWQRAILWLFNAGLLQQATVFITGSNARDLQRSAERFPGRPVKEVRLHPLGVADYAQLRCFQGITRRDLLSLYFRLGGFPHAIRDYVEQGIVTDATYETYANWIFGDAHRFQRTRETLVHILFRIVDCLGSQVTWQRLLEKTPVKRHETVAAYVEHLETAFLCRVLNCYDPENAMAAPRKAKKLYFIDPLLYAIAGGYLRGLPNTFHWWDTQCADAELQGRLFESVVVNEVARRIDPVYYWYSANLKREVDLLLVRGTDLALYEIKSQPQSVRPVLGRPVTVISPASFAANEDIPLRP